MKRLYYLAAFCTALLTVAACQQELANEEENAAPNGPMTLTALTDIIDTKTTMEYKYDIKWQKGDQITVWDEEYYSGTYDTFTLVGDGGTTSGSFRQDGDENVGGNIIAYYPANIAGQYSDDIWWPEVQHQDQQMLMYAQKYIEAGNDETLQFKSMGAIMQLVVTSKTPGVVLKSIKIQDTEKALSGRGVFDDGEISFGNSNKPVVLDLGTGVALGETAKFFNICIPPGTYNNLTFTFTSVDGAVCTKTRNTPLVVERNVVGRLTTACEFTHEAVQLWEDGPFWATTNIGAASPEEYGWYFTYANVEGYSWDGTYWKNALTGATLEGGFTSDNYDTTPGKAFGKNPLDQDHDAAHVIMGGDWRIPTAADFEALMENTTITKTSRTYNGTAVRGMLVTGKGEYSDRSIFFPAAGNGAASLQRTNDLGNYGTSAPATIWSYVFSTGVYSVRYNGFGDFGGRSIRPVFSPNVPVTGISLDRTSLEIYQEEEVTLTATLQPANATSGIVWSSSDPSVVSVDQDGKITGIGAGYATVIAKSTNSDIFALCTVCIKPYYHVTSVGINKTGLDTFVGATEQLTAIFTPSNATNQNVSWASNNSSVARVSSSGLVTAVSTGTATITVTTEEGSYKATCTVNVKPHANGVSLDKTSLSLCTNEVYPLVATVSPANALNQNVTWFSNNTGVVTVDANGQLYGVGLGTATVTVTTEDGSYKATCTVKVKDGVRLWKDGPIWSRTNVGASRPEDSGLFFSWGNKEGHALGSDGNFDYAFNSNTYSSTAGSEIAGDIPINSDAARYYMGGDWRMPTYLEFRTLFNEDGSNLTEVKYMQADGVRGMVIRGKGNYSDHAIFLPKTGMGSGNSLSYPEAGRYWSRSIYSNTDCAMMLYFSEAINKPGEPFVPESHSTSYMARYYGLPIRPVQD